MHTNYFPDILHNINNYSFRLILKMNIIFTPFANPNFQEQPQVCNYDRQFAFMGHPVHRQQYQPKYKKFKWNPVEDEKLKQSVEENGTKNWTIVAQRVPGRSAKQCRERYVAYLAPHLNHKEWTQEEDLKLLYLHSNFSNRWAKIASMLPGRSANSVKNRYNLIKKKQVYPDGCMSQQNESPASLSNSFEGISFSLENPFSYNASNFVTSPGSTDVENDDELEYSYFSDFENYSSF